MNTSQNRLIEHGKSLHYKLSQLPLRRLGFKNVPAVPVDIPGMMDMLVKLGVKLKVYDQALRGLANTYTIRGSTARAYTFLYGGEEAAATRGAAQEHLHGFLRRNPSEFGQSQVAEKLEEQHTDYAQHHLTTLL